MIEKAFEERNSSRLQTLVAQVEVKIRNHDAASVCASSAPPVSAAIAHAASSEPEFQTHVQTHNANLFLRHLPQSRAVSEYHRPSKVKRGPRPRILVTTADGPVSASSSRLGSSTCKHEAFRKFAFATGRRHLAENMLGESPCPELSKNSKQRILRLSYPILFTPVSNWISLFLLSHTIISTCWI